jgi:hypothetical protein
MHNVFILRLYGVNETKLNGDADKVSLKLDASSLFRSEIVLNRK